MKTLNEMIEKMTDTDDEPTLIKLREHEDDVFEKYFFQGEIVTKEGEDDRVLC